MKLKRAKQWRKPKNKDGKWKKLVTIFSWEKLPKTKKVVENFLLSGNKRGGSFSKGTVKMYKFALDEFFHYIPKEFDQIKDRDIEKFSEYLEKRKLHGKTINQKLSTVKALYRYIITRRLSKKVLVNPVVKLIPQEKIRTPESFIRQQILSREEVRKIIEATKNPRDNAILTLLYNMGARVSELCNLKMLDVDLDNAVIEIHGKGGKIRENFLNPDTLGVLKLWLLVKGNGSEYLFTSKFNNSVSTDYVRKLIHRKCLETGVMYKTEICDDCKQSEKKLKKLEKKKNNSQEKEIIKAKIKFCKKCSYNRIITPHSFRHTFIMHAIEDNVLLTELAKLVGHSSLSTLLSYTALLKQNSSYLKNFKGVHKI